ELGPSPAGGQIAIEEPRHRLAHPAHQAAHPAGPQPRASLGLHVEPALDGRDLALLTLGDGELPAVTHEGARSLLRSIRASSAAGSTASRRQSRSAPRASRTRESTPFPMRSRIVQVLTPR